MLDPCAPSNLPPNGVRGNTRLCDADFEHFHGLRSLNMSGCSQATLTDGAFAHLGGIRALNMGGCSQPTITDGAFVHLRGISST